MSERRERMQAVAGVITCASLVAFGVGLLGCVFGTDYKDRYEWWAWMLTASSGGLIVSGAMMMAIKGTDVLDAPNHSRTL